MEESRGTECVSVDYEKGRCRGTECVCRLCESKEREGESVCGSILCEGKVDGHIE